MTITQLEYVIAVAKHGSFTKASEKCNVTQPTLSMQVQNLEEELKIKIFIRGTKPIKLTEVGKKLIEQGQVIVKEAIKMKDIVIHEKNYIGGEFKLGIIPSASSIISLFINPFIKKYPNVNLKIKELNSSDLIKKVLSGDINGGIISTPLNNELINEIPLYYEPFVAYVPITNQLFKVKKLKVEDLEYSSILTLEEKNSFTKQVVKFIENFNKKMSLNIKSFETLIQLSDQGFGITLLPLLYSKNLSKKRLNSIKYFEEPEPAREISMIFSKNKLKSPIIKAISNSLEKVCRDNIKSKKVNIIFPF
tara:strand:+ start:560 stop:1477 length:918 start_codon:yes stop_codon:yes gene_type:complete